MDSNAPGPSSSSTASSSSQRSHQQSSSGSGSCGGISSNNSWCSFDSAPPPPTPFDQVCSPVDEVVFHSSSPFFSESEHNVVTEYNGSPIDVSPLSPADRGDPSISPTFRNFIKEDPPRPRASLLRRRISDPEVFLRRHKNDIPENLAHCVLSPTTVVVDQFRSETLSQSVCSSLKSNNHVLHRLSENDAASNSLQFSFTLSKEEETGSPLLSDSAAASEEDARISSTPLCSSQIPEHTLSDISGPCSSSCVEKLVPVSFINGEEGDERAGERSGYDLIDGCGEIPSVSVLAGRKKTVLVEGSSTTSTSSLSDSEDTEDTEGHRELYFLSKRSSRSGSSRGEVLLPPPEELEEVVPMTVDTCEDYWTRLHDISINGCILEYTGIGKSIHDNGFAQSNTPLTPLSHYFEITILDPGESCYIAIGLARKDYNVHKNPGWCRGSIAYHADDGKIFIGGGVGTPFGPRCTIHDVLGCGIIFPVKYGEMETEDEGKWPWEDDVDAADGINASKPRPPSTRHRRKARTYTMGNFGDISSESEDDIWWNNKNQVCEDKVKVFFMRNHKLLGMKEVRIPKGGFFPTIGMMSTNERVSVDLHPLSG